MGLQDGGNGFVHSDGSDRRDAITQIACLGPADRQPG
jgi:hypothetical protein